MFSTTTLMGDALVARNRQELIMCDIFDILLNLDGVALDYEILLQLRDKWYEYGSDIFIAFRRLLEQGEIYIA